MPELLMHLVLLNFYTKATLLSLDTCVLHVHPAVHLSAEMISYVRLHGVMYY